ncbi:hypothetical protein [Humidisolicoccus flavus]|uniref:hypothetical protein n=1 Tax=Humidisolicoccus flavus TaxID=3111414 RepID=UPI0032463680
MSGSFSILAILLLLGGSLLVLLMAGGFVVLMIFLLRRNSAASNAGRSPMPQHPFPTGSVPPAQSPYQAPDSVQAGAYGAQAMQWAGQLFAGNAHAITAATQNYREHYSEVSAGDWLVRAYDSDERISESLLKAFHTQGHAQELSVAAFSRTGFDDAALEFANRLNIPLFFFDGMHPPRAINDAATAIQGALGG